MDRLWVLANIAVALVAIPNLISMLFLSDVFSTLMNDRLSGRMRFSTAQVDGTDDVLTR